MPTISEFQIRRDDYANSRLEKRDVEPLGDGEVLVKVERFALTANNVTYAVVGERIGYWKFFPVQEDGWGIVPVWGIAEVVQSECADVTIGERLYGYWPMASHFVMTPAKISADRLFDGAAHRRDLPPVYNSYARLAAEPGYDPYLDDERMVLFPLYATSFCLYDFFLDNDWFGAERIIVPSASSKTAIGVGYAFKTDETAPPLLGLTSQRNKATVDALGLYDETATYDDIADIAAATPSAIIDMSGNGEVLNALHKRLGENMRYTSNVGVTHYDSNKMGPDFIQERSAMFFAPGHIKKRTDEWGPGAFEKRAGAFWHQAALKSRSWLTIQHASGFDAIEAAWGEALGGKTPANSAWTLKF